MGRILRKLKKLSLRPLTPDREGRVENTDALTATGEHGMDQHGTGHQGAPTDWLKPDDGRPRH